MEGAWKSRGHSWDERPEICKVQFSDAQPHSKGCLVLYEMGREERSRDLGHRGREERPIVVRAGLESLNDAFGSLARDAMKCANQGDCPTALIAQIATLCESLDAALCREVNHQPNTIAGHIARTRGRGSGSRGRMVEVSPALDSPARSTPKINDCVATRMVSGGASGSLSDVALQTSPTPINSGISVVDCGARSRRYTDADARSPLLGSRSPSAAVSRRSIVIPLARRERKR